MKLSEVINDQALYAEHMANNYGQALLEGACLAVRTKATRALKCFCLQFNIDEATALEKIKVFY